MIMLLINMEEPAKTKKLVKTLWQNQHATVVEVVIVAIVVSEHVII